MYPIERHIESGRAYDDPAALDVDFVLDRGGRSWRIPAFWRGGGRWTARFAAPEPGEYDFRWETPDGGDPHLNGHEGVVVFEPYEGDNALLRHGPLRVSASGRYFEHADGTPFSWLGDTWWTGLSDRLAWEGFQALVADRAGKGFSVVQIVAGLVSFTERAPSDPGFCNEGGYVWDAGFTAVNPGYFDAADRRIRLLVDSGIVPAIVGGWRAVLAQMGVERMKRHWRYVIARYGAYPVVWVVGGELYDAPPEHRRAHDLIEPSPGWTEVAAYLKATDPYGRLVTAHEINPPFDFALQDESLTDFDMFQSGHFGWPSISTGIAQVTKHYSRVSVIKPVVQGEIGYEQLGDSHYEDFQRAAFWTTMLNGAAGFTYGALGTWEAYAPDKPPHRIKFGWLDWDEGMRLPGSTQIGYGVSLLRRFQWWRFEPRPDWVIPRGTTLLEPHDGVSGFDIDHVQAVTEGYLPQDERLPLGEWADRGGTFRLPYAAGIPGEVRVVYLPYFGFDADRGVTVLGLESGVRYHASYWQPSSGITFDLGTVEAVPPGERIEHGALIEDESGLRVAGCVDETDVAVSVEVRGGEDAELAVRVAAPRDRLSAHYARNSVELRDTIPAAGDRVLARVDLPAFAGHGVLAVEARGGDAVASLRVGDRSWTTPIVRVGRVRSGTAGTRCAGDAPRGFDMRRSPERRVDHDLDRDLYDARDRYRGRLEGGGWDDYGRRGVQLLDAYRPEPTPTRGGDWILLLDARPEPRP